VSDTQHSPDIGSGHVPASVVTDVRHHEASQADAKLSGTGWPTAQRSCRNPTDYRGQQVASRDSGAARRPGYRISPQDVRSSRWSRTRCRRPSTGFRPPYRPVCQLPA
jgi:hypothetical protein